MKLMLGLGIVTFLSLFFSGNEVKAASCQPDISGNHTITIDCSFAGIADGNNESRLVDGVDFGTGSTNSAVLTIQAGILTINANQAIAAGSVVLAGGSIALADGAIMKPGTPIWLIDADSNGYPEISAAYAQMGAPINGRRRNNLLGLTPSSGWRRAITLTYSGTTLTNHDVVWSVDTASAITAGHMTSDCGDIRIKDSDATTELSYWIEGGCNTASTQIWTRVPSIPGGGKTIYMDYDGMNTTNGFELWTGTFSLMYNTTCPAGWTQNADFNSSFPYGSGTYGTTGGASSHSHAQVSGTDSTSAWGGARSKSGTTTRRHVPRTHTHTSLTVDVNTASNVLPPYLDVVMCKKADLVVPASFIALFDTTVPSGWTRFSTLDSIFPRGATTYGGTGGAPTHSHSTTGGYNTGSSGDQAGYSSTIDAQMKSHYHQSSSGSTATASNLPSYLDVIFGQTNAQTAASAGLIAITDVIPPLGWTRFTALDSKFPRGAPTYGGTGEVSTHSHSVTITTGGPLGASWNNVGCCTFNSAESGHQHNVGVTTDSQSNIPPYTSAIYIKRNTPLPTVSVGDEGSQ